MLLVRKVARFYQFLHLEWGVFLESKDDEESERKRRERNWKGRGRETGRQTRLNHEHAKEQSNHHDCHDLAVAAAAASDCSHAIPRPVKMLRHLQIPYFGRRPKEAHPEDNSGCLSGRLHGQRGFLLQVGLILTQFLPDLHISDLSRIYRKVRPACSIRQTTSRTSESPIQCLTTTTEPASISLLMVRFSKFGHWVYR